MPPEAPAPLHEEERLRVLRDYRILDTAREEEYDDVVRIAARLCGTPMALITLVDESRQWFKAAVGTDLEETDRTVSFCAHNLEGNGLMVIEDAREDPRFADNPFVTGEPGIRFYAGAPLRTPEGHTLGSLCILDTEPRALGDADRAALQSLASLLLSHMELRRTSQHLADALDRARVLEPLVPVCSYCERVRDDEDYWTGVHEYLHSELGVEASHGVCPDCAEEHFGGYVEGEPGVPESSPPT
jgi:GAF domain-containing protein